MSQSKKEIEKMWNEIESQCLKLKILMGGKTGVGKSSIINAIIGKQVSKVASDGKPCTKINEELIWSTDVGDISITDVPGFGEANCPVLNGLSHKENIKILAKDAHLLIMVLKCDDKALELEENFINEWKNDPVLLKVPVIIVINQIDKMKPSRIWDPNILNLENPTSQKEITICSYIDYVSSLPSFSEYHYAQKIIPVSAGEYLGDATFGVEKLRESINSEIPEILKLIIDREQVSKEEKANSIINYYAMTAGASAVQPVPIVDSFIITPIQIAMLIHLGKIYGVHITKSVAGGIVNSIGLSFLGNYLFLNIVSFFPGIKQMVGPSIAYCLTFSSGMIIKELFLTGNLSPSEKELQALAKKFKSESKVAKE